MYDEKEKSEAGKQLIKILSDKLTDMSVPVKYAVKVLRRKLYLRMDMVEQVHFFSYVWALYIAFWEVVIFFLGICKAAPYISRWVWCGANLVIIVLYQLVKLIFIRLKKNRRRNEAFEQEEGTLQWFLKEEYMIKGRFWFLGMVFWLGVYGLCYRFFGQWDNMVYFCPAVFIVFFYEQWIQYEWFTREEYYKEEFDIHLDVDIKTMSAMQMELQEIISEDAFLGYEASRDTVSFMRNREMREILDGDTFEQNVLRVFCSRKPEMLNKGKELLESALELLRGRSVLFKTSFYKDLDYALILSAYLRLVRGQTILLVCSTRVDVKEVLDWMQEEIDKMNGLEWWSFEVYRPFGVPGHVLALYCIDFLDFYEDDGYAEFRDKLGLVFLQEPAEYMELYRDKIVELCFGKDLIRDRCLAVSSGKLETLDIVNWGFRDNNIYRGQLWKPIRKKQVMYWKEGEYKEKVNERDSMGAEWGIEAPLLKYLLREVSSEKIVWVGGRTLPVWDILWVYKRYCDIDVSNQVIPEEFGYGLQLKDVAYVIAEDFLCNYRKTADLLVSRGAERTAMLVIVPGYLLRDFMGHHGNNVLLKEGITGKKVLSKRNIVQSFFCKLSGGWIPVSEIKEELPFHDKEELQEMLKTYLFGREYPIKVESRFIEEECYHIISDEYIKEWAKRNVPLKYYSDFEGEMSGFATDMTYNTIYQKHLPGQQLILGNKSYWFRGIVEKDGRYLVKIERNTQVIRHKTYYRQVREYTLQEVVPVTAEIKYINFGQRIQWEYEEADITVKTLAFVAMDSFMDVNHGVSFFCKNVPDRVYYRKRYIKISLGDTPEIPVRDFAVWMKESFFSLCPEEVDYLAVCVENYDKSVSVCNLQLAEKEGAGAGKCVYIIEDRDRDSGILQDIFEKQRSIMGTMREYMQGGSLVIPEEFKQEAY